MFNKLKFKEKTTEFIRVVNAISHMEDDLCIEDGGIGMRLMLISTGLDSVVKLAGELKGMVKE